MALALECTALEAAVLGEAHMTPRTALAVEGCRQGAVHLALDAESSPVAEARRNR